MSGSGLSGGSRGGWRRPPGGGGWTGATGTDPAVGLMALATRVDRAKRTMLFLMGQALVREAQVELSKPGTGRIYRRGGGRIRRHADGSLRDERGRYLGKDGKPKGRYHQASAPGNPPAADTGILRASVGMESEDLRGSVRVGTPKDYGRILELLKDRPWLSTAATRLRAVFGAIVTSQLRSAAQPRI